MNLEKNLEKNLFELLPLDQTKGKEGLVISKKRLLLGRSLSCDLRMAHSDISAVHAVIEIGVDKYKVYDMNSSNGTYVNGKKIIAEEFQIGDVLKFGTHEYKFKEYVKEEVLPPPLDILDPTILPSKQEKKLPSALPLLPRGIKDQKLEEQLPYLEYPLSKDPKAMFSEYIFEDADVVYPVFKYKYDHSSVEIIILYKDQIHSVDYLPKEEGEYGLVGKGPGKNDVEYPLVEENDRVPFVEIRSGSVFVYKLHGYDFLTLSDQKNDSSSGGEVILNADDIFRFAKGDIEIFVRSTDAPPDTKVAPILHRDKDFWRYLIVVYAAIFGFIMLTTIYEVDLDLLKEKAPERIATILYKKKVIAPPVRPKKIAKVKVTPKPKPEPVRTPKPKSTPRPSFRPKKEPKVTVKPRPKPVSKKEPVVKRPPKATSVKATKVTTSTVKRKTPKKSTIRKARSRIASRPLKGPVAAYKMPNFKSTIPRVLAKSSAFRQVKVETASSDVGATTLDKIEAIETIKKAKVSKEVGNLTGITKELDTKIGTEGLADKKRTYEVGIPTQTNVLGSMDPDVIRRILMEHIPQFRSCYQRVLARASSVFGGRIILTFEIGASGHVTRKGLGRGSASGIPGEVKSCVLNVLGGIKFPEPLGGGVVEVKQPMNFFGTQK